MKIALVNGSPKGEKSASHALLDMLAHNLSEDEFIELEWSFHQEKEEDFMKLIECDALVFACPLYVDGIPSNLLRKLTHMEEWLLEKQSKDISPIRVYGIVNNGFYDDWQNKTALNILENWSEHCGFTYGGGLGVGGGGMLVGMESAPDTAGPKKNIGLAMINFANEIKDVQVAENKYTHPNFPKCLYKLAAQFGWRQLVKQNGLKAKDLSKQR